MARPSQPRVVRLRLLRAILALAMALVGLRLVDLQVLQAGELSKLGENAPPRETTIVGRRGEILDRRGKPLAVTIPVRDIQANPTKLSEWAADLARWLADEGSLKRTEQAELKLSLGGLAHGLGETERELRSRIAPTKESVLKIAEAALGRALGMDREGVFDGLERRELNFFVVRGVSRSAAAAALKLDIGGIAQLPSEKRAYPNGSLAGHVVGVARLDLLQERLEGLRGLGGLEGAHNKRLSGTVTTKSGDWIAPGKWTVGRPVPGDSLVTTIDSSIQAVVERILEAKALATGATGGCALVLDPRPGDILSLAAFPKFDPGTSRGGVPPNTCFAAAYQPGSVLKTFAAAAALEAGRRLSDPLRPPGSIRVAGRVFREREKMGPVRNVAGALAQSSNVGTIMIARDLAPASGPHPLVDMYRRFGFGQRVGIGMGETPGQLRPAREWVVPSKSAKAWERTRHEQLVATAALGSAGVSASPLQLAAAYGAIANDGVWVRPRLVRGWIDSRGAFVAEPPSSAPEGDRIRVVAPRTAALLRAALVSVVDGGTGARARIPGYRVAGKTGTNIVPGAPAGPGEKFSTFIGMVPADAPRIVVLVMLENSSDRYAADAVAPVFRDIASQTLAILGVPPPSGEPVSWSLAAPATTP